MRPLDGIVALDLTRLLPGAVATAWLSNFGAEVLRVEQPGIKGPGNHLETSLQLARLNRGKKTIAVDLKSRSGKKLLLALSEKADVLIESFRPGVMARLGLGYEDLRKRSPRLIYVSLTGYGQSGSYATFAGHDLNYMSLSGLLDRISPPGGPPTIPDVQIADLAGGSAPALMGILLAMEARRKTGRGQLVDVSMMARVSYLMTLPIATLQSTGRSKDYEPRLMEG
jgi:alpha-methylacyl-CoA racemase